MENIVYVKEIAVADLPDELREQTGELETVFAIGSEDGRQLALVPNKAMAFAVARQNEMVPLSVH